MQRVQLQPEPRGQLLGFGDNSLNPGLSVWMNDPQNGRANVVSEVLLGEKDMHTLVAAFRTGAAGDAGMQRCASRAGAIPPTGC
jgi:hypothetical protein